MARTGCAAVRQIVVHRFPLPPDGPLAAAIVASQRGFWPDAIALWRDLFRVGVHDPTAAACIAEAALHLGHRALADHMLAQLDPVPDYLESISLADQPEWPAESLDTYSGDIEEDIAAFRADHPMGDDILPNLEQVSEPVPNRKSPLGAVLSGSASRTQAAVEAHRARGDTAALRDYTADLIRRGSSPAHLHWAIVGLHKLQVSIGEPLIRRAIAAFAAYELPADDRAIADARLARALGYPGFARIVLRRGLTESRRGKKRAAIRRRLAGLAAERGRWLDDSAVLSAADFIAPAPARAVLLDHARNRSGPGLPTLAEPVELAFGWLLEHGLDDVTPYKSDNRLLMIGNTLGCGGMERMLARTYRHFADGDEFDHVDLALLDYADGAPSAFYAQDAGVSARDIVLLGPDGEAEMPFAMLPPSWNVRAHKLHAHIVETRPRVIHAWNDLTGLLAAFAGLIAGCPKIVIHFHHAPHVPLSGRAGPIASYPTVYRALRRRHDIRTVFCAEAAARGYAQWWREPQDERFRVLYNGFDWDVANIDRASAKAALGMDGDRPVIGTVLRFSHVKQPLLWTDAAIALAQKVPDVQFLMVGDGLLRADVANRFRHAGLAASLHMPGQVDTVPAHLAAMDLFWLTSQTEGLPNVLIEAQFSGVPIAAFDVGGIGETFVDGETGILVPPNDIDALVGRSAERLADTGWREKASQKAVEQAQARFSADAFFDGLRGLYGV